MSIAWTTLVAIVLMLPGVAFVTGLSALERHSREILRSTAIGDIATALFAALVFHSLGAATLWAFGLTGEAAGRALSEIADAPNPSESLVRLSGWLPFIVGYLLGVTALAFVAGLIVARLVVLGPFRFAATHRWIYDVLKFGSGARGVVTAYVLTTTVENNRALMYKGRLSEFYVGPEGAISYLILQAPERYMMAFDGEAPTPSSSELIFKRPAEDEAIGEWTYLHLHSASIANVSFSRSKAISTSERGRAALLKALDEMRHG